MSFDLTKCETIPATHYKAKTRDGRDVEIVSTNGTDTYPIVGFVDDACYYWCTDGFYGVSKEPHSLDLVNIPRKIKVDRWMNVYDDDNYSSYRTKEEADRYAADDRIACIRIEREVEEGEGL